MRGLLLTDAGSSDETEIQSSKITTDQAGFQRLTG